MEKDAETEQRIRERAYQIWIEKDGPPCRDKEALARANRVQSDD